MGRKRDPKFDDAYGDYLSGLSLEQVADKISVSRQCVFKAFKKRGFALRGPNFQPEQFFDNKKFTLRPSGYYSLTLDDRTYMHRYVWEFYNGKIPEGYDVHHINEIKSDNDVKNLECLLKGEHTRHHNLKRKNGSCG